MIAPWEAVSDEVRRVFIEADCKHDTLNTIDLGAHRVFTVAETNLRPSVACRSPPIRQQTWRKLTSTSVSP